MKNTFRRYTCKLTLTLCCLTLCACSIPVPKTNGKRITAKEESAVVVGISDKTSVMALFGKTKSVSFDSGYEVWVYPYATESNASPSFSEILQGIKDSGRSTKGEFVILFGPDGKVHKTRIRLPPARIKDAGNA